jgi:uncharacterized repeat protein (TIGR03803 family)
VQSPVAHGQTYTVLHSFNGTDGSNPYGSLTLSGSTLYGMTANGGPSPGNGNVFSINTNGTGFKILHSFNGTDGRFATGSLTLSGSTLYGMTANGGPVGVNSGTIFSINTNGTGFGSLHVFNYWDGDSPYGSLTLSGSTLYGMAAGGGSLSGMGNIFSTNANGTGFQNLYSFSGIDGDNPQGDLTLSGSTLYGMTENGGAGLGGKGNIFSINANGTGFKNLYIFNGTDGKYPYGDLTLSAPALYGMTEKGGRSGDGNIFSINTDGTGFQELHSFNGADGLEPFSSLTLSGSTLYGMTLRGGSHGDGVVFSLTVPEPSTFVLLAAGVIGLLVYGWRRRR